MSSVRLLYLATRILLLLLLFCPIISLIIKPVMAAELQVSTRVSKRQVSLQETVTLTVTLKGLSVDRLILPGLVPPSFTILDQSDKKNLGQDAQGRPLTGRVLIYKLQPTKPGKFRLGAFAVNYFGELRKFDGEVVDVLGASGKPTPDRAGKTTDKAGETESSGPIGPIDVRLTADVDSPKVYVGQRLLLSLKLSHNCEKVSNINPIDFPQFANFWNRPVPLSELNEKDNPRRYSMIKGQAYVSQDIARHILYPTTSGKLEVPALSYAMVAIPRAGSSGRPLNLKTRPITIEVMPLPEAGKPAYFRGAVGECKLTVTTQDRSTQVGVPIRLQIEVETEGNLDAITPPPLPNANQLKFYQPERVPVKESDKNDQKAAIWQVQVVPTAPGNLTIPPINFAYFDPIKKSYQSLQSEPLPLEVAAAPPTVVPTTTAPVSRVTILLRLLNAPLFRYLILAVLMAAGLFIALRFNRWYATAAAAAAPVAATSEQPSLSTELTRLVNGSYGKLHRGDERAYANDLLKAMRTIFEKGFQTPAAELTPEKITDLLNQRQVEAGLIAAIIDLYQDCERICFAPVGSSAESQNNYARFNQARETITKLIALARLP